jgi:hypothetical protein
MAIGGENRGDAFSESLGSRNGVVASSERGAKPRRCGIGNDVGYRVGMERMDALLPRYGWGKNKAQEDWNLAKCLVDKEPCCTLWSIEAPTLRQSMRSDTPRPWMGCRLANLDYHLAPGLTILTMEVHRYRLFSDPHMPAHLVEFSYRGAQHFLEGYLPTELTFAGLVANNLDVLGSWVVVRDDLKPSELAVVLGVEAPGQHSLVWKSDWGDPPFRSKLSITVINDGQRLSCLHCF